MTELQDTTDLQDAAGSPPLVAATGRLAEATCLAVRSSSVARRERSAGQAAGWPSPRTTARNTRTGSSPSTCHRWGMSAGCTTQSPRARCRVGWDSKSIASRPSATYSTLTPGVGEPDVEVFTAIGDVLEQLEATLLVGVDHPPDRRVRPLARRGPAALVGPHDVDLLGPRRRQERRRCNAERLGDAIQRGDRRHRQPALHLAEERLADAAAQGERTHRDLRRLPGLADRPARG